VRIYSEVGQGTTMCLYLPRHTGAQASEPAVTDERAESASSNGEVVLVIDDEPTVRMLVGEVLTENGYRAIEASDGPSGLSILNSDVRIDLLITDVGLPGGLNGRQVADAARMVRPDLKVLFITGYAENSTIGHGHLDHGMSIMTKPFHLDMLARKIRDILSS
jgi:CheY-like chemotaxis protein